MCQLLGVSSNLKVDIRLSLKEFRHRGNINYHGWGFAFYQDSKWKIIKEPSSLSEEDIKAEEFKFESKIIIGHVRLKTCGELVHIDTHPFEKDGWTFAHNGNVKRIKFHGNYELTELPEGETDSEFAFYCLLSKLGKDSSRYPEILEKEAERIKEFGNFNFLLSDGERLFAYGDDSLYYAKRKSPFKNINLIDDEYEIDLNEIKKPEEKAVIIATAPLTKGEEWNQIVGLKIFRDGEEE